MTPFRPPLFWCAPGPNRELHFTRATHNNAITQNESRAGTGWLGGINMADAEKMATEMGFTGAQAKEAAAWRRPVGQQAPHMGTGVKET